MKKQLAAIVLALCMMSILSACGSRDGDIIPHIAPTATSVPTATNKPAATTKPSISATPKTTYMPSVEDGMITEDNGTEADRKKESESTDKKEENVLNSIENDLKIAGDSINKDDGVVG